MDELRNAKYNKSQSKERHLLTNEIIITWLGLVDIFQTFEDLESVRDKPADIQAVRRLARRSIVLVVLYELNPNAIGISDKKEVVARVAGS
jgi:hypothetical protein